MSITDPREMRKILRTFMYRPVTDMEGNRLPEGQVSVVAALVNAVANSAHFAGLSGEDHMTVLAYTALVQLEAARKELGEMHLHGTRTYVLPTGTEFIK